MQIAAEELGPDLIIDTELKTEMRKTETLKQEEEDIIAADIVEDLQQDVNAEKLKAEMLK